MKVYRIARWKYLEDLSGKGAKIHGGRWNEEGFSMLYTSENLALAVLELLTNHNRKLINKEFGYVELTLPDVVGIDKISKGQLGTGWRQSIYSHITLEQGTIWLKSTNSLALSVPSSVLVQERNILINPNHGDFSKLVVTNKGELQLDRRIALESLSS